MHRPPSSHTGSVHGNEASGRVSCRCMLSVTRGGHGTCAERVSQTLASVAHAHDCEELISSCWNTRLKSWRNDSSHHPIVRLKVFAPRITTLYPSSTVNNYLFNNDNFMYTTGRFVDKVHPCTWIVNFSSVDILWLYTIAQNNFWIIQSYITHLIYYTLITHWYLKLLWQRYSSKL